MRKAVVSPEMCHMGICSICPARQMCPTKAIVRIDDDEPVAIDATLCRGCGKCVVTCPWQAIRVEDR